MTDDEYLDGLVSAISDHIENGSPDRALEIAFQIESLWLEARKKARRGGANDRLIARLASSGNDVSIQADGFGANG